MLDPTLVTAFSATLETLCNQALQYDPGSRQRLTRLAGKTLAVEATAPPLTLYLQAQADGTLALMSHYQGDITTRLRGPLLNLLSLTFNAQASSLSRHQVEVIGSTSLLLELQSLMQQLDIDWEDALNAHLGDVIGHPLAEGLRQAGRFLHHRGRSLKRLAGEYVQEELRLLPSPPELAHYCQQVDQLRLDSDRLEARLQHLQQRLQAQTQAPSPSAPHS